MPRAFKVLSKVTYKRGTSIKSHALPKFEHTNGLQPRAAELLCAGHCERNGERMEFQDVRLFFPTKDME